MRIATIVAPLLVLAALTWLLVRELPRAPSSDERAIQAKLARADSVIFLGNSKVGADVDPAAVASAVGVPEVSVLGLAGTMGNSWYAALEQQVIGRERRPRLIVVYGVLRHMLISHQLTERDTRTIEELGGDQSVVIAQKVYRGSALARRATGRASTWRIGLLDAIRDRAAGPIAEDPTVALERVLGGKARFRTITRQNAVPIAEREERSSGDALDVEQTLIPDFIRLAESVGARMVFARGPVSPTSAVHDDPTWGLEASVLAYIGAHGAGWADLRDVGSDPTIYFDGVHMNSHGRARLTDALVGWLDAHDAMGEAPFPTPEMPLVVRGIERVGGPGPQALATARNPGTACGMRDELATWAVVSNAALREAGLPLRSPVRVLEDGRALAPSRGDPPWLKRCGGEALHRDAMVWTATDDRSRPHEYTAVLAAEIEGGGDRFPAWWVYPSSELRVRVDGARHEPVRIEVLAHAFGRLGAHLRVGEATAGFEEVAPGMARAVLDVASLDASWEVGIHAATDAWLLVHRMTLVDRGEDVLGRRPVEVPLRNFGDALVESAPPVITARVPDDPGRVREVALPEWAALSTDAIAARTGFDACSPLRVSAGTETRIRWTRTERALGRRGALMMHVGGRLLLSLPNPELPAGLTWTIELEPRARRPCGLLYPGDVRQSRADARAVATQRFGLTRLRVRVAGFAITGREAPRLAVEILSREQVVARMEIPVPAEGPPVDVEIPLDPPISLRAQALSMRVSVPEDAGAVMLVSGGLAGPVWAEVAR